MSTVKTNAIEPASGGTITITGAALATPALGTPASGNLANCTGLPASSVVNTPSGGISATTVQAALNELDTAVAACLPKSGGTMTDNLAFANGKGIDFSGTPGSGTSELLNDYEEGTWSPVLTPATGSITPNATFTGGTYTKIGNLVTANGCVYVTSVSSPAGLLKITGLPFATKAGAQEYRAGAVAVTDMAATLTTGVQIMIAPDLAEFYLTKIVAGVASDLSGDVQASSDIRFSITYQI
jgi:hypothetical protein